jgi:hypothetical protein
VPSWTPRVGECGASVFGQAHLRLSSNVIIARNIQWTGCGRSSRVRRSRACRLHGRFEDVTCWSEAERRSSAPGCMAAAIDRAAHPLAWPELAPEYRLSHSVFIRSRHVVIE